MQHVIVRRRSVAVALLLAGVAVPAKAQILSLTVNAALIDLDARVTLDGGRITLLEQTVTTAITALSAQVSAQASGAAGLDARITGHDGAITALQGADAATALRIAANTAAVGAIDSRLHVTESSLADLGAQLSAQASLVAGQGGSAAALGGRIDAIAGGTAANAAVAVTLGGRVDTLTGDVTASHDAIVSLDARTTAQGSAITAVSVQIADAGEAMGRERRRNDQQDQDLASQSTRIDAVGSVANAAVAGTQALRADVAAGRVGIVQVAANDVITVGAGLGGTTISVAGSGGTRRISGVSAGSQADDVATVGQLTGAMASTLGAANLYTDRSILRALDQQIGATRTMIADNNSLLRREMNGAAANGAALAGLPQSILPGKGFAGVSMGGRGGEVAIALGASKAFDGEHAPVLRAGAAIDTRRGDLTYNAGVGFHF